MMNCVFCGAEKPFSQRTYDKRSVPHGWPRFHCFENKTIAICSQCGGGFVYEAMNEEDISSFYSAIYAARGNTNAPRLGDFHELTPRFFSQSLYVKSFINLRDGMRILELGPNIVSALPALSLFCRPRYYYFDQVDSPIIAHYGGRRLGAYASGEEIVRHVGKSGLDLVYASHSLEHVNPGSLEELVRGISTAIGPGGHLFFEVPDDLSINKLLVPHTLFFTEASILRLLVRHNFEIVNLARWGEAGGRKGSSEVPTDPEQAKARGSAPPSSGITSTIRNVVLGIPFIEKAIRPLRLQRGLMLALRRLPTPYGLTPYFRVIARRL